MLDLEAVEQAVSVDQSPANVQIIHTIHKDSGDISYSFCGIYCILIYGSLAMNMPNVANTKHTAILTIGYLS